MNNRMKRILLVRIGILTLILYCITVIIYFTCFYEPFKPIYGPANEMLKAIERENTILHMIFFLLLSMVVSFVIVLIYEEVVLYTKATISVYATLKSKASVLKAYGDNNGFSSYGYNYSLTFITEDGKEMVFQVFPKYYAQSLKEIREF
mgnify:CR=1 FL=1